MGPRAAAAADEACTCQAQRSRYWVQGKLEDGLRKREQVKGSGFNLRRVFGRIPFFGVSVKKVRDLFLVWWFKVQAGLG